MINIDEIEADWLHETTRAVELAVEVFHLQGQHDQKDHGRRGGGRGGLTEPVGVAFTPESWDDFDKMGAILADQLGIGSMTPLDPQTEVHPRSGFTVPKGLERRVATVRGDGEQPAEFDVFDHGRVEGDRQIYADGKPNMGRQKIGTEPIDYVYRAVSESEYEQIKQSGVMQSDGRGVIAEWEGTNAAAEPADALSYVSRSEPSRIIKVRVDPADDWFLISSDQYVRTRNPIPIDRIEAVSQRIGHNGSSSYLLTDDDNLAASGGGFDPSQPRDEGGKWTNAGGAGSPTAPPGSPSPAPGATDRTEGARNEDRPDSRAALNGTNEPLPTLPSAPLDLREVQAVEFYMGLGIIANSQLRSGTVSSRNQSKIDALDDAFAQSPGFTEDTTVYRLAPRELVTHPKGPGWGDPPAFTDAGYLSTTYNKQQIASIEATLGYEGTHEVIEITIPKGTKGLHVSGDRFQNEMLLPRGGTLAPDGRGGWRYETP